MIRLLTIIVLLAFANMMQGKNDVEMITINVDSPLNAQQKVTAHMKANCAMAKARK